MAHRNRRGEVSPQNRDPRRVNENGSNYIQRDRHNHDRRVSELEREEVAGYLAVGKDNEVAVLDSRHPEWRIYAGNADPDNAPFRVSKDGKVVIESSSNGNRLEITNETIKVFEGGILRVKIGDLT